LENGRTCRTNCKWGIHPQDLITHRFPLDKVDEAYAIMASGKCGKVAVVFDEEIK